MVAPAAHRAAVLGDADHVKRRHGGFDEQLKHGGRQGFWLARQTPGGWSVRAPATACAGGYRAEGWFPQLSRDARRAVCRTSSFEPPPQPEDPA